LIESKVVVENCNGSNRFLSGESLLTRAKLFKLKINDLPKKMIEKLSSKFLNMIYILQSNQDKPNIQKFCSIAKKYLSTLIYSGKIITLSNA
jgi:hypothetical protein